MSSAYSIDAHNARVEIATADALEHATRGEIVVVPGLLADVGFHSIVTELFLSEIAALTVPSVADELRRVGLARLHDHLDPPVVATLLGRLDRRAAELAVPIATALVSAMTSEPRPSYFICSRVWIRAQVPYGRLADYPELLAAPHLAGHLRPTLPHRDVSLTHPRGSISIWSAIGPVRTENTIALFPTYERPSRTLPDDELWRRPPHPLLTPELDPGDVLLFDADRLHASVPNQTDETRVAIGSRVLVGRRLRYGPGPHWRAFYDSRFLGTRLERFATVRSTLTVAAWRRRRAARRWARAGLVPGDDRDRDSAIAR
jgi:hypothetical protein